MPKTATGKVQRRHVATAMIATEKNETNTVAPREAPAPKFEVLKSVAAPSTPSAMVQTPDRFLNIGRSMISRVSSFYRASLSFAQGRKKSKMVH